MRERDREGEREGERREGERDRKGEETQKIKRTDGDKETGENGNKEGQKKERVRACV